MRHDPNPRLAEWTEQLQRYFDGDLATQDAAALRDAYARTTRGESVLDAARTGMRELQLPATNVEARLTVARRALGHDALRQAGAHVSVTSKPARERIGMHARRSAGPSLRKRWMQAAGLVAGAAVVGLVWYASGVSRRDVAEHPSAYREYAAKRGQQAQITLPDGSRVQLAPQTRLRYTVSARGERQLDLDGQAFFTVTHDASASFTVRAGNVSVRVLGTAFDVRRYASDSTVQVAVVEGRVAAGGRATPTILPAGTIAQVTDSSATTRRMTDETDVTAWRTGVLVFRETPVPQMLETIGRWYGYTFKLADPALAERHVSVQLRTDRPAEALQTLKAMLSVTLTFSGDVVTLRSERATPDGRDGRLPRGAHPVTRSARDPFASLPTEVGK